MSCLQLVQQRDLLSTSLVLVPPASSQCFSRRAPASLCRPLYFSVFSAQSPPPVLSFLPSLLSLLLSLLLPLLSTLTILPGWGASLESFTGHHLTRHSLTGLFASILILSLVFASRLRPASRAPLLFRPDTNIQVLLDLKYNLSAEGISCITCSGEGPRRLSPPPVGPLLA